MIRENHTPLIDIKYYIHIFHVFKYFVIIKYKMWYVACIEFS